MAAPRYLYVTSEDVLYRFTRESYRRYLAAVAGNGGAPQIEAHATVLYAIEADVSDLAGATASAMLVQSFHEPEPETVQ